MNLVICVKETRKDKPEIKENGAKGVQKVWGI